MPDSNHLTMPKDEQRFERELAHHKSKDDVVDDILEFIEGWRLELAKEIAKRSDLDGHDLTAVVQKIIDRILFLRFWEGKAPESYGFLSYGTLQRAAKEKEAWVVIKELFREADKTFNSGLFAYDETLDGVTIDTQLMRSIIKGLYFPECPYEWSVLPVEILGTIYERFLGEVIRFTRKSAADGHSIEVLQKPEVQKANGVYYTPAYIVDYIVEQTIGKKVAGKSPKQLEKLHFVDPACGSGSFLVGAYRYLLRHYADWYMHPEHRKESIKDGIVYKDTKTKTYKLSLETKCKILTTHIYGVDLDGQAVEVARMSLFLKMLEDESRQTGNLFCATSLNGILPKLDSNIVCGNSLVAPDDDGFFENKEDFLKLHPFDWQKNFADIFKRGGFDAVIGNPPYISAPTQVAINSLNKQRNYIASCGRYTSIFQKWDIYVPFIELGLNLLNKNGLLGMIVPFSLTNQLYGQKLRDLIIHKYELYEISDLSGVKIFKHATVANCIPFVKKASPQETVNISYFDEETSTLKVNFSKSIKDLIQDEKSCAWFLASPKRETTRHVDMNVLGDFCYISKGMVLNADERTSKGEFSKEDLISEVKDEIHPKEYIEAKDIGRYHIKRVRYLEYNTKRSPDQLSRPTFRELYEHDKLVFNRLGKLQVMLDDRVHFLQSDSSFLAILWNDLIGVENKSITTSIKKFSKYSRAQMEVFSRLMSLKYILGIMNSKYAIVLLNNLRAGDYHIYPEHIRNIPIPLATENQQNEIIAFVEKMLETQQKLLYAQTPSDREFLKQQVEALDRKIDGLVYTLYGLTAEDIAVVEGT